MLIKIEIKILIGVFEFGDVVIVKYMCFCAKMFKISTKYPLNEAIKKF